MYIGNEIHSVPTDEGDCNANELVSSAPLDNVDRKSFPVPAGSVNEETPPVMGEEVQSSTEESKSKRVEKWMEKLYVNIKFNPASILKIMGLFIVLSTFYNTIYYPVTDAVCEIIPQSDRYLPFCMTFVPNFSAIVNAQVKAQEELLKNSAQFYSQVDGSLSHDIKKAEMATRDLVTLVKYSGLPVSKILGEVLTEFVKQSFVASKKLQTLQVRAQGSLDRTMTYVSYTLESLGNMKGKIISPREQRELMKVHKLLMEVTDDDLKNLIFVAEDASEGLKKLDDIQEQISEICHREKRLQLDGEAELMSDIWSILGGNTVEKRKFSENLELLHHLDSQRKNAVERINIIMDQLTLFQQQLDDLRDETVKPLLIEIPLELHLTNVKKALMRLQSSQIASKQSYDKKLIG